MNNFAAKLPLTLHKLYGDHVVFTSRPSFGKNPWLTTEGHQSNMLTARELLIADMPVIVHEAAVGDKSRALFEAAGIAMPENFRSYTDEASYNARLREAENNGEKIFFQYTHEAEYVNSETSYVDRATFIALNNKMRLAEWTKGKFLPHREVVNVKVLADKLRDWEFPYVLKPADDHPTAGGYGVMICYNDKDLKKALQRIGEAEGASDFIIEDFIQTTANYCVQYAYSDELGMKYLGASIQNTDEYGKYKGNTTAEHVPEHVIKAGQEIMQNGVDAGYRGIAGFDLLLDDKDHVYAIDLNFRQNGSTSLLLINDLLAGEHKKFLGYYSNIENSKFYDRIMQEVKSGQLFPLAYYDGDFYSKDQTISRFVGIWHGTKEEVAAKDAALAAFNS
ncbi:L-aspartate--L-methionine ligase LdmS [Macrococcus equipercicus]|uniref:ATP-grasp domain-containing protein n=1 Tax=Macrococcus equipercicus TaxID=69967 RepID=A0A9Q9F1P8_9STAP|nr:ATP-grasp domain-containing protein [Macrococcus equipercicus]KAA1039280.1 ATP-grasp domain-containing protein [Macrococcus equipercicus]UTH13571.1 ATP-grasp domain-containing protein [Macrococcus equipercicus]